MTLTEFLLARIAEDEVAAEYWFLVDVRTWTADGGDVRWRDGFIAQELGDHVADHIARHDPARVLAECAAKRQIVEVHSGGHECPDDDPTAPAGWFEDGVAWCPTLRALALPYADHEDYREEWKP